MKFKKTKNKINFFFQHGKQKISNICIKKKIWPRKKRNKMLKE